MLWCGGPDVYMSVLPFIQWEEDTSITLEYMCICNHGQFDFYECVRAELYTYTYLELCSIYT